jgi:ubiquinone/menaquinone biosynthesis C-methylase UbiE
MEERVYGKKISIDTKSTVSFYDQRAKTNKNRKQEYTTVLLGDQDPEYSLKWDKYEKELIIPKLMLNKEKVVLDLGCGMGRWADAISGICGAYHGVDFSAEMVALARQKERKRNCYFYNMSVADAVVSQEITCRKYDIVIVTGVSMYINDEELAECYRGLGRLACEDTLFYFEESVGKNERLTLNHIWSENLNDYYGAIYRTRDEYIDLIKAYMGNVEYLEEGYMDFLDKKEQSETSHWYSLIRRKGD